MVSVVTKSMNLVTGMGSQTKTQNKTAPNDRFDQVLNQQTDQSPKETEVKKPTGNLKQTASKKVNMSEDKPKMNETSEVELDQLEKDVIQKVTELLGITEEELKQVLTQLNMTVFDLLVSEKLNAFLTCLYGVDSAIQLLTLPESNQIKNLKSELGQMMKEMNIDLEKLQDLIKQHHANQETTDDKVVAKETSPLPEQDAIAKEDSNQDKSQVDITITDNRTEKDDSSATETLRTETTEAETTTTDVNPEQNKTENNDLFNIPVNNQTVQKVEVIEQGGVREVVTYNMNTEDIMDQIVSSVKVNLSDDTNEMLIQLRPEHLGKLALSLTSVQGVITANFMADNPAVKEMIEANLAQLRVSLQEQGINVDKLEVVVTDNQLMDDQQQDKQFSNNQEKKKRAAKMMSVQQLQNEDELDETTTAETSSTLDSLVTSSVDYSA